MASAASFELATTVTEHDQGFALESEGYTKLNLFRASLNHTGSISLEGELTLAAGTASLVMWSKVGGQYYFSRMPGQQSIEPVTGLKFTIPFLSPDQPITEVILQVEMPEGGKLRFDQLTLVEAAGR
ncbi:MAG: hypothetical protein Tsb002_29330 [Wenzhouxiangellaceae bacterium]